MKRGHEIHLSLHGWCTMPFNLEEEIPTLAKHGFEGVEIRYQKLDSYLKNHTPLDLKHLMEGNEIKVVSIGSFTLPVFFSSKQMEEKFEQGLEIAKTVSCPIVQFRAPIPPYEMDREKAYYLAGYRIKKFVEQAHKAQIKLAIEPEGPHPFVAGPYDALKIIEIVAEPNFGLVVDTYLYYKSYVNSISIKNVPLEKVFLLHVADCENMARPLLTSWNRLYPGLGVVPLKEWLGILKRKGYKGYYSIEVYREDYWQEGLDTVVRKAKESFLKLWEQI